MCLGYFVLCHNDLAWHFAFISITKNGGSEVWYFGRILFEAWEEELDTAFWNDLVNMEIALSMSRGHFGGKLRDSESSNFCWKSCQSMGPDEIDCLRDKTGRPPKVNCMGEWSLDKYNI